MGIRSRWSGSSLASHFVVLFPHHSCTLPSFSHFCISPQVPTLPPLRAASISHLHLGFQDLDRSHQPVPRYTSFFAHTLQTLISHLRIFRIFRTSCSLHTSVPLPGPWGHPLYSQSHLPDILHKPIFRGTSFFKRSL